MSENNNEELPTHININLQQGLLIYSIIDVISRRGGFLADELKPVGDLFEYVKKEFKIEQHFKNVKELENKKQKQEQQQEQL